MCKEREDVVRNLAALISDMYRLKEDIEKKTMKTSMFLDKQQFQLKKTLFSIGTNNGLRGYEYGLLDSDELISENLIPTVAYHAGEIFTYHADNNQLVNSNGEIGLGDTIDLSLYSPLIFG